MKQRKILVTSSLPYGNGPLHLGHMLEYIQTDIWVRFQQLRGHTCYYICGIDAHGSPIMLRAEKEGITPTQLIERIYQSHQQDFAKFHIKFDSYYTTHSKENRELTEFIFNKLKAGGHITTKTIKQAYDAQKNMFLPDRFVRGECPRCGAPDQYGDSCDICGATYNPLDMKNPVSVISGTVPVEKESEHLFFDLPKHESFLINWMNQGHLKEPMINKLKEWFTTGLQAWDISRDAPYFGFTIPGYTDKYFYVWLDAPIGYMASFKKFTTMHPTISFEEFWDKNSTHELYHFIGKDVAYFHTLFWPALLAACQIRLPSSIYAYGFLTVNGKKMSKSRGTFISANTYLKHLNPEYLRYYFASKLNNGIEDLDLNLEDFKTKVNADLVGKLINIASRCSGFISKFFAGKLSPSLANPELFKNFLQSEKPIADYYENRQYSAAIREIMRLADIANQYINDNQPWILAKQPEKLPEVQTICSLAINLFKTLIIYLQPVLPALAKSVSEFLNTPVFTWQDSHLPLLNHTINVYQPLMTRIEEEQIIAMQNDANEELKAESERIIAPAAISTKLAIKPEISLEDFMKVDLRLATIVQAEHVEGADKLLKLQLDLGEGEIRQVFAGIKTCYQPEALIGKQTIMVANLQPRKMRFGLSSGMVLVAKSGEQLWLTTAEPGAPAGSPIQ